MTLPNFDRLDRLAKTDPEFMNSKAFVVTCGKQPYRIDGKLASYTSRTECATYEQVKAACLAMPEKFDGIGRVFFEDEPFVGFDYDHCFSAGKFNTGELELLDGAFFELSTSRTGLHAYFRAKRPECIKNLDTPEHKQLGLKQSDAHQELYFGRRFFKMTGWLPEGFRDVERLANCQDGCEAIAAQMIKSRKKIQVTSQKVESRRHMSNHRLAFRLALLAGWKFTLTPTPCVISEGEPFNSPCKLARAGLGQDDAEIIEIITAPGELVFEGDITAELWRGNWQGLFNSQSEADAFLLRKLCYWTNGNVDRALSIFGQSGLANREKAATENYQNQNRAYLEAWCSEHLKPVPVLVYVADPFAIMDLTTHCAHEDLFEAALKLISEGQAFDNVLEFLKEYSDEELELRDLIGAAEDFIKEHPDNLCAPEEKECYIRRLFSNEADENGIDHVLDLTENYYKVQDPATYLRFGIKALDDATAGGVRPGEYCSVVGAPAAGKTSLALCVIRTFCRSRPNDRILFVSADMKRESMITRLIEREEGRPEDELISDCKRFGALPRTLASVYGGLRIVDNSEPLLTLDHVFELARSYRARALIIDYLTVLPSNARNDLEHVRSAIPKLHRFCSKYMTPVLLLNQMSRESQREQAAGIFGNHGRGGGAIEEQADHEIELAVRKDGNNLVRYACIVKTRHGFSHRLFELDYDGKLKSFTGDAWECVRRKKEKATMFEHNSCLISTPELKITPETEIPF